MCLTHGHSITSSSSGSTRLACESVAVAGLRSEGGALLEELEAVPPLPLEELLAGAMGVQPTTGVTAPLKRLCRVPAASASVVWAAAFVVLAVLAAVTAVPAGAD